MKPSIRFSILPALALVLVCSEQLNSTAAVQKQTGGRKVSRADKKPARRVARRAAGDSPDAIRGDRSPHDFTHSGAITPEPGAPQSVSSSHSSLRLRFQCAGNADRHEVHRRAAGETSFRKLVKEPQCSPNTGLIFDLDLLAETEYCYFVRAKNETNEAQSATVCHTTLAPSIAPAPPVVWLQATGATSIKVILRDRSSTESFFEVHRRRPGESEFRLVGTIQRDAIHRGTGEEEFHNDEGLPVDTAFEYFVRAGYRFQDNTRAPLFTDSEIKRTRTRPADPVDATQACINNGDEDLCNDVFLRPALTLTYYRNFSLTASRPEIVRAIIVIHGKSRQAWRSFQSMEQAATAAGVMGETIIVAPLFLQWADTWRQGGTQVSGTWSSFAVVDTMLEEITKPGVFPNLREIVIAGHSAGGQFVQRYLGTNRFEQTRPTLSFRYIVANPSSYMYLDNERVGPTGRFSVPETNCLYYNFYKYGLQFRNAYASAVSSQTIKRQYTSRTVSYLLGALDTGSTDLEMNCAANLQGQNRLKRGLFFYRHLLEKFPDVPHRIEIVPGVAHNSFDLYSSQPGQAAIFF